MFVIIINNKLVSNVHLYAHQCHSVAYK